MELPKLQSAIQIICYSQGSSFDGLQIKQIPVPSEVPEGGVLVRTILRPVNPTDLIAIRGIRPAAFRGTLPATVGSEGLGVVVECGAGVTKFTKGQRVVGGPWPSIFESQGTWQQYLVVSADNLFAVPDGVSDKDASQFFVNPVTVYGMLDRHKIREGEWLLQTAAGSALGRQMIVMAKLRGIKTINVVRRTAQKAQLIDLGADEVISSQDEDLVQRVMEITGGKGAWAATDCCGAETTQQVVNAVRPGGKVFIYGQFASNQMVLDIMDLLLYDKRVVGFQLGFWVRSLSPADKEAKFTEILDLMAKGVFQFQNGESYPLECVKEALLAAEQPGRSGKVFLEG
ncbi:hypothetical protein WJX72_006036 [[Myrmecia] bisecta]|uniref:Enoyl reductase (ER) domain-containing protein n=1 Tax=[Myrmecia] bisecta TaxID=41462 RepID=A0AAW1QR32_9CHLO